MVYKLHLIKPFKKKKDWSNKLTKYLPSLQIGVFLSSVPVCKQVPFGNAESGEYGPGVRGSIKKGQEFKNPVRGL